MLSISSLASWYDFWHPTSHTTPAFTPTPRWVIPARRDSLTPQRQIKGSRRRLHLRSTPHVGAASLMSQVCISVQVWEGTMHQRHIWWSNHLANYTPFHLDHISFYRTLYPQDLYYCSFPPSKCRITSVTCLLADWAFIRYRLFSFHNFTVV